MIHCARCLNLLGRHVLRRAHHLAGIGQCGGSNCAIATSCFFFVLVAYDFCQTKIRDFHTAPAVEQNILRLDVAMNDALIVCELQRIANLWHDGQRFARGDAAGSQQLAEVDAVHEFHEEKIKALGAAEVVNSDDAGMVQLGEGLGFAGEPFRKRRILPDVGREDF